MLLLVILLYADHFEPLVRALFNRSEKTPAQLSETPLKFQIARYFSWTTYRDSRYNCNDSPVQFFAQFGDWRRREVEFLSKFPGVLSSVHQATDILHAYSTAHHHGWDGGGDCFLQRLLTLGADPNSSGYAITPLQQAVAVFDFEGVELLLDAGADANGLGVPGGIVKSYSTVLGGLEGNSPLYICYHNRHSLKSHFNDIRAPARRKIATLLIKHGAKAITRQVDGSVVEEPETESKLLRPYDDKHDGWFSDRSSEDTDESWETPREEPGDVSEDSDDRSDQSGDKAQDR